jgi:uncharacterized protein (TIGR03546 family)
MSVIFSALLPLLDPLAKELGAWMLVDMQWLRPVWSALYHMPLIAFTYFNNTVILGHIVIMLVVIAPLTLGLEKLLTKKQVSITNHICRTNLWQTMITKRFWRRFHEYKLQG